jgi:hypothetical protein
VRKVVSSGIAIMTIGVLSVLAATAKGFGPCGPGTALGIL